MHNYLEDMVLMAWQSHQITNYFNAYKDLHFIDNILKVLMESNFSLFHNTCMYLRVCQNLELIHIFSVFSQKILKRKKIKQHSFSCNTKLKLNPPYSVSFQFGPNWVSHPEKKNKKQVRGGILWGSVQAYCRNKSTSLLPMWPRFLFLPSMPLYMYLAWVCCWFSSLLHKLFLQVLLAS